MAEIATAFETAKYTNHAKLEGQEVHVGHEC